MGKTSINVEELKRLPVFLGEVDVIKQIQAQPGVSTVGEVASGFNVRGGSADQNLVLYDDIPVFNTSHALGFFSAFNADVVSNVSFYRGGIPARYGGRVSSVLDISSKEGDFKSWSGGGGIGIISAYASAGGPIRKDTTSIQLSARSTYSNWMLRSLQSNYTDLRKTAVGFFDASLKISHRVSADSKLTFSGYMSGDSFRLIGDTTFHWNNYAGIVRYDTRIGATLLSRVSLSLGRYSFAVTDDNPGNAFRLQYGVLYPSLKMDFEREGRHHLSFGLHNTWYRFEPGSIRPVGDVSAVGRRTMPAEQSLETALYASDGITLNENLFLEAGLRLSMFNRFGPTTVHRYAEGMPRSPEHIVDSVVYGTGEVSQRYIVAEPRASLRLTLADNSSLKIGYHRAAQYLHLVTNTAAITPMDIWQSSDAYFRPQISDQFSAGIYRSVRANTVEAFVEGYYKRTLNTLDFKDGADLILNPFLETALLNTEAEAYGVEFALTKVSGRLQGFVNYTWSRAFLQTVSVLEEEQINEGLRYPANHDQPHVLNLNWRYGISRRIFFSGNFVYRTGRPVSMPVAGYVVDGIPISGFSHRNRYRIPDYHRLDIAFIIEGNHKRKKILDGNWIISFYNAYLRKNAYSVFSLPDEDGFLTPYKLTVVGTVIPSVTYSFKF